MSSTTGRLFRVTTFGESHGVGVGCIVDGCPPRLELDLAAIQADLDRRRPGQSRLVTQRQEADEVEILSGVAMPGPEDGADRPPVTLGTPIAMLVRNADQRPGAYGHLSDVYRPSHADYTYDAKYGVQAASGGGRASARETVGRVAAAALARQLLAQAADIDVLGWVSSVGDIEAVVDPESVTLASVEAGPTRCPDPDASRRIETAIDQARRAGDSLGGVVTCVARRVPAGLGDPVFDKLDATLATACMSLPAAKGFEVGSGFGGTAMTGSSHNDPFVPGAHGRPDVTANRSGGIQGGISNGAPVICRVAFKPTATIGSEQDTVNRGNEAVKLAAKGRHDPCVLPRAVPLVEAAMLLCLADAWLAQRAVDVL
ncbi:MAG: chorismate synthase [Candidatus Microthrix parvicella]|nr:chorismate synthase [Candidatus Microthrix parvicella]